MKDNRTLEQKYREMKLQEVSDLYYGSDKARDTYAKDTPGQTPGVDHNPDFQRHGDKGMELAVDGVPEKGGMINKPQVCLLYTSPSPRDQRGSRMPGCA